MEGQEKSSFLGDMGLVRGKMNEDKDKDGWRTQTWQKYTDMRTHRHTYTYIYAYTNTHTSIHILSCTYSYT